MFLLVLGGSLIFGAGLLAAASFSEGMLLAIRTAAQSIGWLLLLATAVGLSGLRRGAFGQLSAAMVALLGGLAVLYVSYFQWETVQGTMQEAMQASVPNAPVPPSRNAAAADLLPEYEPVYKATLASLEIIAPAPAPSPIKKRVPPVPAVADACASLKGIESLQCRRCAEKTGVAWIVCQESARLEYCEGRHDEACFSAIPSANLYSPPG
ncbi:MAG TPA: hypothetical protein VNP36_14330 [Burkholderiales bacterium]|nr:hypothetical protein [Burkholderiales bacterium]